MVIETQSARLTGHISVEFEIQWNIVKLLFMIYSSDDNDILRSSICPCDVTLIIRLFLL